MTPGYSRSVIQKLQIPKKFIHVRLVLSGRTLGFLWDLYHTTDVWSYMAFGISMIGTGRWPVWAVKTWFFKR